MTYMTEQQVVVTSALVIIVGLIAFTIGMWVGHGKREEAEEAELDRAVARRQGGRHRHDAAMPGVLLELPPRAGAYGPFPVSEEELVLLTSPLLPAEFEVHAGQAMAVANVAGELSPSDQPLDSLPGHPGDPSVTAWTAAMAADMDRYVASLISGTDEQLKEITR